MSLIRKLIECPVCFDTVDSKAKFCVSGHLICETCIKSVTGGCPVCRDVFPANQTNSFVNQLLPELLIPCQNQDKGCDTILKLKEMADHENICSYNLIICMYPYCSAECIGTGFINHVRGKHTNLIDSYMEMSPDAEEGGTLYDLVSHPEKVYFRTSFYEKEKLAFVFCMYVNREEKEFHIEVFSIAPINGYSGKFLFTVNIYQGYDKWYTYSGTCQIYRSALTRMETMRSCKNKLKFDHVFLEPAGPKMATMCFKVFQVIV